jgi:hypothetical protein
MTRRQGLLRVVLVLALSLSAAGCMGVPKGFLKPSEGYLAKRQLQMRQYETTNEEQIISAVAGVLQDLSFTLDNSETKLGLVSASKQASAVHGGQVALAFLAALGGNGQAMGTCDKNQVVKASVVTHLGLDGKKTVVRVTFQRVVWNMNNQVNRVETIADPDIYQKFFTALSKAIFLEAQQI